MTQGPVGIPDLSHYGDLVRAGVKDETEATPSMIASALNDLLEALSSYRHPMLALEWVAIRRDDGVVFYHIDDGMGTAYYFIQPLMCSEGQTSWEMVDARREDVDATWAAGLLELIDLVKRTLSSLVPVCERPQRSYAVRH